MNLISQGGPLHISTVSIISSTSDTSGSGASSSRSVHAAREEQSTDVPILLWTKLTSRAVAKASAGATPLGLTASHYVATDASPQSI